jgi:sugar/nucleoside kinase (ribokinase family)
MPRVQVAVVGNLSLDRVDGEPPRPGGPPFYAARALAALAVPACLRVKCSATDRPRFRELDVGGLPVEWRDGARTATYAFSYHGDARSMEVLELGEPWAPHELEGLRGAWVHVGALYRGEFSADTLAALAPARISFDGQGLVRAAATGTLQLERDPDPAVLGQISVLKLSEDEALTLVDRLDERALSELGVPEVVVTLGSRGSLVVTRRRLVHVPTDPIADCDPTGAGDAFAAAYVVARNRGHAPRAAAQGATRLVLRLLRR